MTSEREKAESNLDRYRYGLDRGHKDYIDTARTNEDFYLGGGLQWDRADRLYLEELGRSPVEVNNIFPAVNTAIGHQLQARVALSYKPRNGAADQGTADVLTKVVMQICDDVKYQWLESQVFADGLIQQRGFLDFRIGFDENMNGTIKACDLDPMDVIIDPDAQGYDPDRWQDVTIARWLTIDEIAELYGKAKANRVEREIGLEEAEVDFDDRSHFGTTPRDLYSDTWTDDEGTRRVLVLDRQHRKLVRTDCYISPLGDIIIGDLLTDSQKDNLIAQGYQVVRRLVNRIRWTVTSRYVVLHDDWSPYKTYTVIPYFPYFRRGRSRGMVDNLRSPQKSLNKFLSQYQHIMNSTANGGFFVQQGSLTNLTTQDLEDFGSRTGLVIEYKRDAEKPEKIQPNQMPIGIETAMVRAENSIRTISGISEVLQGQQSREVSGKAIDAKGYLGQVQLGGPLDNLAMTRYLVGRKLLELVQGFYTEERLIMITDDTDVSNIQYQALPVNVPTATGEVINDLTLGTYDVVVSNQPLQATFQENQFTQAMDMRNAGVAIPDMAVVELSSLSKKADIIKAMQAASSEPSPLEQAKISEMDANARLKLAILEQTRTDTVNKAVDAQYAAVQAAGLIAGNPAMAPVADELLQSAGYQDQNAPPIVPGAPGAARDYLMGSNTNPQTPVPVPNPTPPPSTNTGEALSPISAKTGGRAGIETPSMESV